MKKKAFVENMILVISILFLTWIFFSWLEIAIKNTQAVPTYTSFNFFEILLFFLIQKSR